jgi:hypothetical protein
MINKLARLGPLSGIAFVAAMVGVISLEGEELPDSASPEQVLASWADRSDTRLLATTLAAIAVLFLVLFAASLRGVLRSREHGEASASAVAFGGGVVAAAGLAISAMVTLAAARAGGDGAVEAVVPLDHLAQSTWVPVTAGLAVMMLAAGVGGLLSGALPKIVGWTGLVLGVAQLTPGGIVAFMLTPLWIIAVSVIAYRRATHTASSPAPRGSETAATRQSG